MNFRGAAHKLLVYLSPSNNCLMASLLWREMEEAARGMGLVQFLVEQEAMGVRPMASPTWEEGDHHIAIYCPLRWKLQLSAYQVQSPPTVSETCKSAMVLFPKPASHLHSDRKGTGGTDGGLCSGTDTAHTAGGDTCSPVGQGWWSNCPRVQHFIHSSALMFSGSLILTYDRKFQNAVI